MFNVLMQFVGPQHMVTRTCNDTVLMSAFLIGRPNLLSKEVVQLLEGLFEVHPGRRPSAASVLCSEWVLKNTARSDHLTEQLAPAS